MNKFLVQGFVTKLASKYAAEESKPSAQMGAAGVGAGALMAGSGRHEALGTVRRYHVTSQEAAENIKKKGLLTAFGGGKGGEAGTEYSNKMWRTRSKGKIYTTGDYLFAKQLEIGDAVRRAVSPDIPSPIRTPTGGEPKGLEALKINADYMDFQKSQIDKNMLGAGFEQVDELVGAGIIDPAEKRRVKMNLLKDMKTKHRSAVHVKDIPIEDIAGSAASFGQRVRRRMSRLPEYIKKHPGRFGKGVLKATAGAGLMYLGGKELARSMSSKAPEESAKLGADMIAGGRAEGKTDADYNQKQLNMGTMVELEHTDDLAVAREIARDHLEEDKKYYTRLLAMEADAEEEKEKEDEMEEKAEKHYQKVKAEYAAKLMGEVSEEELEKKEELTPEQQDQIRQFLRTNRSPTDQAFHGFAESIDVEPDKAEEFAYQLASKTAGVPFLKQDRPEGVKDVYRALKRDHPEMSAEMKARIAARQGKPGKQKQGPPYKGPISGK